MLEQLLKVKNISIYELAKESAIPYTTLREIVKGENNLGNCNCKTVQKLANALNMTIDELLKMDDAF